MHHFALNFFLIWVAVAMFHPLCATGHIFLSVAGETFMRFIHNIAEIRPRNIVADVVELVGAAGFHIRGLIDVDFLFFDLFEDFAAELAEQALALAGLDLADKLFEIRAFDLDSVASELILESHCRNFAALKLLDSAPQIFLFG